MMEEVTIRQMLIEDLNDIMEIERLSFSTCWTEASFLHELQENKNVTRYLSAVCSQKVVGYAGLWKIIDEGHITNIAVHPQYRKKGIGEMLLKELIAKSESEGVLRFTLEVRTSNKPAIALYKKMGFVTEGVRKGYYSDNNEDAEIMWKRI